MRLAVVLLLALAAILRIAFVLQVPEDPLYWDEVHYHLWGRMWAAGIQDALGFQVLGPTLSEAWQSALKKGEVYSAGLGALYTLLGSSPRAVFVVQAILDVGSCAWIYGIARALAGPAAGLAALALAATYEPFLFTAARLQTETLASFLYLSALWAVLCAPERWRTPASAAAGVAAALAMLTRPAYQGLLPVLLVAVAIRHHRPGSRAALRCAGALALGFFLLIAPRGVATWNVLGHPLWSGDLDPIHHVYSGVAVDNAGWKTDRMSFLRPPAPPLVQAMGGVEAREPTNDELRSAVWLTVLQEPVASARVAAHKLYLAWSEPYNDSRHTFVTGPDGQRGLHRSLVLLGIFGLPLALHRPRVGAPLLLVGAYLSATYLSTTVEIRYALPLLPLLVCSAGAALATLGAALAARIPGPAVWIGAGGLVTAALWWMLPESRLLQFAPAASAEGAHALRDLIGLAALALLAAAWGALLRTVLSPGAAVAAALVPALAIASVGWLGRSEEQGWREWRVALEPGREVAEQVFTLPGALEPPLWAELKLDLIASSEGTADAIVQIESVGDARIAAADLVRKADLPRGREYAVLAFVRRSRVAPRAWQSIRIPVEHLGDSVTVTVRAEGSAEGSARLDLAGDHLPGDGQTYHGPTLSSSRVHRDRSLYRYLALDDLRMRRETPLAGDARSRLHDGREWRSDDLSPAPGLQRGRFRIFLVLGYTDDRQRVF